MKTRIAELDGAAREWDRAVWLEKRRWFQRRYRRRKGELIKNMAAHLMKTLIEHGVTAVYIGYPRSINQDKANERNSSWPCWKVMIEIARCAENFGIAVYAIEESDTSKYCAYHGCEVEKTSRPSTLPSRPHVAQRHQRCTEHPGEGRREAAGAVEGTIVHADAQRSAPREEEKQRKTNSPAL